jgi:hypothetical protein
LDVSTFEALPYRYGRDDESFYYVATVGSEMWGHNELRRIPDVDLATVEVLKEGLVRDKSHLYHVFDDDVVIEPVK